MLGPALPPTRYRLDRDDRIAWMDDAWVAFAERNRAPELANPMIRGQPLWDFVAGIETRHLYELLFASVRRSGRVVELPFRCDSPDLRRFMKLAVEALPGGELELRATLLREEQRSPAFLLDVDQPRGPETLSICSFCKRIPVAGGAWVEVEEAVEVLNLFANAALPRLSHGVCPDCRKRIGDLVGLDRGSDPERSG